MKTEVYNLIILDESGSMQCLSRQTINGCNETLDTIKSVQRQFADTQTHYVSIFAFQSGGHPSRYIVKNTHALEVSHIGPKEYQPGGCTPLYDAVGSTVAELRALAKTREMAIGAVTIITDGEENSSSIYTRQKVASMIEELKEQGWNFNFIGANIDVKRAAKALSIDNTLEFQQDEAGMKEMFEREHSGRIRYAQMTNMAIQEELAAPCGGSSEETKRSLRDRLKKASKGYFGK